MGNKGGVGLKGVRQQGRGRKGRRKQGRKAERQKGRKAESESKSNPKLAFTLTS